MSGGSMHMAWVDGDDMTPILHDLLLQTMWFVQKIMGFGNSDLWWYDHYSISTSGNRSG